jgi:hypothetical protein
MRTAAAYLAKSKAEALARTFKVQDTNRRAFTSTLYRGSAICGPVDYTEITYVEACFCNYINSTANIRPVVPPPRQRLLLDGGFPNNTISLDGGNPLPYITPVIDGGTPGRSPTNILVVDGNSNRTTIVGGFPGSTDFSSTYEGGAPNNSLS